MNGYKDYLQVTGKGGGSVVPGGLIKEMTVSLQAKRDGGDFGWVFYAAQDDTSPTTGWEKYLGVIDNESSITAQRYYNQGERLADANTDVKAGRWHYLTIVYTEESIIIYADGEKKAETANNASLSDILGSDSVWYIGKANWRKSFNREKGEHFRGWIDNYKVLSRAWTEEEVRQEALKYVDKSMLKEALDNQRAEAQDIYAEERWETYQTSLKNAEKVLADEEALQAAVDDAQEPLSRVQAWMRMDEALYGAVGEEQEAVYTTKTWEPYEEALSDAKTLNENKDASNADLEQAAEKLRDARNALRKKTGAIYEAIERINRIGAVEQTPESSRNVVLARQACSLLTEEERGRVTNLSVLEQAEEILGDYLAEFTFDDEETGFIGGQAVANGTGAPIIRDGALYLDGSGSNWLSVTKGDGSSLLTGRTELTVSFAAKPESEKGNWLFYAAANENAQEQGTERYLGLLEYQGAISAERFHNNGERPETAYVEGVDTSNWIYVTLVHTASETVIYINGEEKARKPSDIALPDIFGKNSILQIGKANWGNGEYYKGCLDNVRILGTALTAEEIKAEADAYFNHPAEPGQAADVIALINGIGDVEATIQSRTAIEQARAAYNQLSAEEKKLVTNADVLVQAEELYQELAMDAQAVLGRFSFDGEEGLQYPGTKVQATGEPAFAEDAKRGSVLSLDGSGTVWLSVTKDDGQPLLTGVEELTVSFYSKAEGSGSNWPFFAAGDGKAQELDKESYLGILEKEGKVTAERYLHGRQDVPTADCEAGWNHIVAVYSADDVRIYVNGTLAQTAENSGALKEILGENSILQIGKANWGSGEYYKGLLDDFAIYNYAFTERDIDILEGRIADPEPVRQKVLEAKDIQQENYTDESYAALQEAVKTARKAFATVTTQEEVAAAVSALQKAIEALRKKPAEPALDYKGLSDKIEEAKNIGGEAYTAESYAALQTAIAEAERIKDTADKQEELDAAVSELQKAIESLRKKTVSPEEPSGQELNYKGLADKIAEAKGIRQGDYTLESYNALQAAITEAERIKNTAKKQEELDAAAAALQKAIERLARKLPGQPGTPEKPQPLEPVKTVKAVQQTSGKSVKISYGKVSGAVSYDIYRSTKLKGVYKKIGNSKSASYVDKKVKASKTYYYKALARGKTAECDSVLSGAYAKVKVLALPTVKVKALAGGRVTVSWKKIQGTAGYTVYVSTKKNKGFKAVKTLGTAKAVKTTVKAKKSARKIFIKFRPYYKEKGKKIYGAYSKPKAVTLRK